MHSWIPHLSKGHCCCSNQNLVALFDCCSCHVPHIHSVSKSYQPFLQDTARTQYFSPLLCLHSGQASVISHLDNWVPLSRSQASPLAAQVLLNEGLSPITNQITSWPYIKPDKSFISHLEQNPKFTWGSTSFPWTSATTLPNIFHSSHTGLLAAPQGVSVSLDRNTPSHMPHFISSNIERSSPTSWYETAPPLFCVNPDYSSSQHPLMLCYRYYYIIYNLYLFTV